MIDNCKYRCMALCRLKSWLVVVGCAGRLLCALEVLRPQWCRGLTGFLPTRIYLQANRKLAARQEQVPVI